MADVAEEAERERRVERAIREHVAAFNAHDLPRLFAGLADDALWQTGQERVQGHAELAELFSGAFSAIAPHLTIRSLLVDQNRAACELVERMTVAGAVREDAIAGFYHLNDDGKITHAKIYRQGSAEV